MQDRIFRQQTLSNQYSFSFTDHVDLLISLKEESERTAIATFLQVENISVLMQKYGSLQNLIKVFQQAGFTRATINRQIKHVKNLIYLSERLKKKNSDILVKKYHELQYKLTA